MHNGNLYSTDPGKWQIRPFSNKVIIEEVGVLISSHGGACLEKILNF